MTQVDVTDNPDAGRYEAHVDGALAGVAEYRLEQDRIVFTHTEVDPQFEGRGVGGALARTALDHVRATGGLRVVPRCPYIKRWIEKHPDYRDLVTGRPRSPQPESEPE